MLDRMTWGDNRANNTVNKLRAVLDLVLDVQQDVQDLQQSLQEKKDETVTQTVERVTRPIQRIDNRLEMVQGRLSNISTDISDGRARLERIQSTINRTLLLVGLALTFAILWGILALVALILYAVSFLTGRDPLARWRGA